MIFSSKPEYLFSNPNLPGETLAYFKEKTEILRKAQLKKGVEKEKKEAKTIENFLNAIKNKQYDKNNLKSVINEEFFNQLIVDLPQDFFKREHSKEDLEKDFDDIFEKELSIILHRMMTDSRKGSFLAGTAQGSTISKSDELGRIIDYCQIYIPKNFGDSIVNKIKTLSGSADIFKIPTAKEQKADVAVNIDISTQVKDEYQKIMSLFNERNFSLKNYSSSSVISLGNTNPLKAIVGSLVDLGASLPVATKAFYAAITVYTREGKSNMGIELANCIYMLRHYYELTGAGLMIDNEPISKVDFLVVNKPDGKVKVISSKEIMNYVFENKDASKIGNPFHNKITINYNNFSKD